MARLTHSPTLFILNHNGDDPAPADNYPFGPLDRGIVAAMFGRIRTWTGHVDVTASGTWNDGGGGNVAEWAFTASEDFTVGTGFLSGAPFNSEKQLANPHECLLMAYSTTNLTIGTMTGSYNSVPATPLPVVVSMSASTQNGSYGSPESRALRVQRNAAGIWVPFSFGFDNEIAFSPPVIASIGAEFDVGTNLIDDYPEVGTITLRLPDWRQPPGPDIEIEAPIGWFQRDYGVGTTVTLDASVEATLEPLTCLPYGYDPNNPLAYTTMNRLWNDDGTRT